MSDIGIHVYDLDALGEEFDYGPMRVTEFVEAAFTANVLEGRTTDGRNAILTWTYGTPNSVSYQTLHKRWAGLPADERERHEAVLAVLGDHEIDTWIIA